MMALEMQLKSNYLQALAKAAQRQKENE